MVKEIRYASARIAPQMTMKIQTNATVPHDVSMLTPSPSLLRHPIPSPCDDSGLFDRPHDRLDPVEQFAHGFVLLPFYQLHLIGSLTYSPDAPGHPAAASVGLLLLVEYFAEAEWVCHSPELYRNRATRQP